MFSAFAGPNGVMTQAGGSDTHLSKMPMLRHHPITDIWLRPCIAADGTGRLRPA